MQVELQVIWLLKLFANKSTHTQSIFMQWALFATNLWWAEDLITAKIGSKSGMLFYRNNIQ